ncbi:hypothetical protein HDV57DRAFT_240242 [Trichoderma longibrachiatum]|uniref:Uncharacterized protein n=1 Tax=Trichoderma longibrachiatum ATCC 18648 TaxID=983965 RepID=A0A2T4C016_TRILO|nr:hypothetical protein M440DRAFT_56592 [Trichoderma longibrachiatum ATCC 18648]
MADQESVGGDSTPRATDGASPSPVEQFKKESKSKRRSLFGFAKKKMEGSSKAGPGSESPNGAQSPSKASTTRATARSTTSPLQLTQQGDHPYAPVSPTRAFSSSPRIASPATSQIFERDVQDHTLLKSSSPAIPSHIQTENYIPPVLDDASEAITNNSLDPDSVEIVTHASHQPASAVVPGTSASHTPYEQTSSDWASELASFANRVGLPPDSASNYGSLDSADVRRLSFISFADVVQSEHSGHHLPSMSSRDNMHIVGLTSLSASAMNRSPSPIRSPVSSQGPGTSPPTSNPGSIKGLDMSPSRKPIGSPSSGQYTTITTPGELNIETMSQALKRSASRDFNSTLRSNPQSPIEGPGSR